MASCELNKFYGVAHDIAGVDKTSAVRMKDDLLFLPVGGKNHENEELNTPDKTFKWGEYIKRKLNKYFANTNSIYGNLVTLTKDPKGTYVQLEYTKQLSDAIDYKNGIISEEQYLHELEEQQKEFKDRSEEANEKISDEGDILYQVKSDNKQSIQELDKALVEFCNANNIKVELLDSLKEKFGGDYNAVFSSLTKTISVAKGKAKEDTLSEEVAHAVFEGLGENNPFVKRAYELIEQLPFEEELDPRYKELYKNDRKMLIKEYAGQKMASLMVNQYKGDSNLKRVLRRILDIFLSLFKSAEQRHINNIKAQLDELMLPVAKDIIQGNKMNLIFPDGPSDLYQVGEPEVEKYQKQLNVFYKSKTTLKKALKSAENRKDDKAADFYRNRLKLLEVELEKYNKTKNIQILSQLGEDYLKIAEEFIEKLEMNKVDIKSPTFGKKLSDTSRVIEAFSKFPGLADKAIKLEERWVDATRKVGLDLVNTYRTEDTEITWLDILKQKVDINRFTMGVGTLVDLADYLARTIGSIIKHAQNKISVEQKKLADEITEKANKLIEWGKNNGMSEQQVYDLFIEEGASTSHFISQWSPEFYADLTAAKKNKDFKWIRQNTFIETIDNKKVFIPINKAKYASKKYDFIHKKGNEALLEFFNFYKEKIEDAFDKLPIDGRNNFIPNIYKESLKDSIDAASGLGGKFKAALSSITGISAKTEKDSGYVENEDYSKDMIPLKYVSNIESKHKSRNLAEVLYKFGAFAISHEQMSDVLPKVTLLKKHLESKGEYVKSSSRKSPIAGLDTNLSKMVSKVIDMQVKGNKTLDEMRLSVGDAYDEHGNKIGKKVIYGSDVADFGLKYNSILRVGLNPLNALSNWLIGDIGNIIEGFGGRYFTNKTLQQATNVYIKDFFNENSKLHKLVLKLNPLQELEDYQHAENLKFKKSIDKDKIKSFIYSPQRITENFLQTRTMAAILMHQKLPNSDVSVWEAFGEDGELKKEYESLIGGKENLEEFLSKLTDKVQRVNQMIHGRYSERDAAIIQQNVFWRMAIQFKKWIPAAIEQRFGKQQYDVRLGDTIEGRYVTFHRLFLSKSSKGEFAHAFTNLLAPIFSYKEKIASGELTEMEVYNMRKNLMEITLILATYLSYIAMGWDDDDEKKRNPYYKFAMSTLDRVSGDMLYFINPSEANRLIKSPVSMSRTVDDLINVVHSIPSIFDDGKDKRKKSFGSKVAKVTPGAKPLSQIIDFFDNKKYQEYNI